MYFSINIHSHIVFHKLISSQSVFMASNCALERALKNPLEVLHEHVGSLPAHVLRETSNDWGIPELFQAAFTPAILSRIPSLNLGSSNAVHHRLIRFRGMVQVRCPFTSLNTRSDTIYPNGSTSNCIEIFQYACYMFHVSSVLTCIYLSVLRPIIGLVRGRVLPRFLRRSRRGLRHPHSSLRALPRRSRAATWPPRRTAPRFVLAPAIPSRLRARRGVVAGCAAREATPVKRPHARNHGHRRRCRRHRRCQQREHEPQAHRG